LGRRLQNGETTVTLFGEDISVNAEIATLHGTSGHADQAGLLRWLGGFKEKPELVFVNHGEDESCEAFKNLLTEKGYHAEAPYSGTQYDLATGAMTVYTEGKKIDRTQIYKGSARANAIYNELVLAASQLLALVKGRKGKTNKDNARLTSQIRQLCEKWKD
jgi:metallo-beta-lactamase family protein